jgi:hypothetical protein
MAGLQASLMDTPGLEIFLGDSVNLDQPPYPDLIIADLCEKETIRVLPDLCAHLAIPLVGLNPSASTLTILSGESYNISSVQELRMVLLKIIQENTPSESYSL